MLHLLLTITHIIFYLVLAFLIINHLILFGYLYIEHNLGQLQDPEHYSPTPWWIYIRNCCLEFFYMCGKFYLFFNKFKDQPNNMDCLLSNTKPTVILLVHGYGRDKTDWWWLRKQLTSLPCPIFTVNLSPTYAPIEQIAANSLTNKINLIKQETDCKNIILISHSMGGLVSSYYSEFLDADNLVQTIISIATPFHGTKISVTAPGANAKQMNPDAEFTKQLREKISHSQKKYYQIATQLDNIVFPWQSELLADTPATQQLVLPFESHLGLLHSKVVAQQIVNWIKQLLN